jgi:predicted nucleotidyltransferase
MVTDEAIRNFADEIARRYKPEKIILFGSHARGEANEDSDVDMLVIMDFPERRGAYKAAEIEARIDPPFALDLLVRRVADVQWHLDQNDCFMKDIIKEGVVLYDAAYETVAQ